MHNARHAKENQNDTKGADQLKAEERRVRFPASYPPLDHSCGHARRDHEEKRRTQDSTRLSHAATLTHLLGLPRFRGEVTVWVQAT